VRIFTGVVKEKGQFNERGALGKTKDFREGWGERVFSGNRVGGLEELSDERSPKDKVLGFRGGGAGASGTEERWQGWVVTEFIAGASRAGGSKSAENQGERSFSRESREDGTIMHPRKIKRYKG